MSKDDIFLISTALTFYEECASNFNTMEESEVLHGKIKAIEKQLDEMLDEISHRINVGEF